MAFGLTDSAIVRDVVESIHASALTGLANRGRLF